MLHLHITEAEIDALVAEVAAGNCLQLYVAPSNTNSASPTLTDLWNNAWQSSSPEHRKLALLYFKLQS